MNPEKYNSIVSRLEKWSPLGSKTVPNGTRLIGNIPHVAPLAYLHQIYPGLSTSDIHELQTSIGRELPPQLVQFLRLANGISLFMKLNLSGLRRSFARDPDSSRLPFSMRTDNVEERPKNSDPSAVFFGGYSYDCSNVFILPNSPTVYHCPRRDAKPILNQWPSIEEFLVKEFARLESLFDEHGKMKVPSNQAVPAAGMYE